MGLIGKNGSKVHKVHKKSILTTWEFLRNLEALLEEGGKQTQLINR